MSCGIYMQDEGRRMQSGRHSRGGITEYLEYIMDGYGDIGRSSGCPKSICFYFIHVSIPYLSENVHKDKP